MKKQKILKCRKCGHKWVTRLKSGYPVRCPNPECQTTHYANKGRKGEK